MSLKKAPLWIKVISVIQFISAGVFLLVGLSFLIRPYLDYSIFLAVVFILSAAFFFFLGKGLGQGKPWARILVIVSFSLQSLTMVYRIVLGKIDSIITLAALLLILYYLIFNKEVKKYFD